MKKKLCIVEDDHGLREALSMMIQFTNQYELVSAFENAEKALSSISILDCDAVLMDINLPGDSGIECVRKLKKHNPDLLFLMCTSYEDDEKIFQSLSAGASGYILKTEGPINIIAALDELFEGGSPMSISIARKVVSSFSKFEIQNPEMESLTIRENEILDLIAKGLMNKEVAYQLDISVGTVRKHIQNIYEKLQVNTRVEAVNMYLKR
ncbi:response regulator transcription factor [Flavobacterium capsici]|uniref:Response regulator transcription factor n=1 Tax=Flavobacterium capsici TaxID=3075618 RepID=A0AA96EWB5_9FLAO|nr:MULTISPECIES: response regulator transcription factor [unclassified Flavobacterium]WNM19818.1 response regulator transcription factor [Flavobacterium sp. PMR2A8]WNM21207.1 response regulator transcription factor [Flavobacterium sp. PMTSA4]